MNGDNHCSEQLNNSLILKKLPSIDLASLLGHKTEELTISVTIICSGHTESSGMRIEIYIFSRLKSLLLTSTLLKVTNWTREQKNGWYVCCLLRCGEPRKGNHTVKKELCNIFKCKY